MVPKRIANKRSVLEALDNQRWLLDILGIVTWTVAEEFHRLGEILSDILLQPGIEEKHFLKLTSSGTYSAKSAYKALFLGSTKFEPWERIWKSWVPRKCSFLWLAAHNRCWTTDRLEKRNMPHAELCVLCDQEKETINHLLVGCVFACQFWFFILQRNGLVTMEPPT